MDCVPPCYCEFTFSHQTSCCAFILFTWGTTRAWVSKVEFIHHTTHNKRISVSHLTPCTRQRWLVYMTIHGLLKARLLLLCSFQSTFRGGIYGIIERDSRKNIIQFPKTMLACFSPFPYRWGGSSPPKREDKRVCVCVCVKTYATIHKNVRKNKHLLLSQKKHTHISTWWLAHVCACHTSE